MSNFLIVQPIHTDLNAIVKSVDCINKSTVTNSLIDAMEELNNDSGEVLQANNIIVIINDSKVIEFTVEDLFKAGFEKLLEFEENDQ